MHRKFICGNEERNVIVVFIKCWLVALFSAVQLHGIRELNKKKINKYDVMHLILKERKVKIAIVKPNTKIILIMNTIETTERLPG